MILPVLTDDGLKPITYEQREDGWYVKTWNNEGFGLYAIGEARERDVKQLIRKDYDNRY